jgi:hypothetical protein
MAENCAAIPLNCTSNCKLYAKYNCDAPNQRSPVDDSNGLRLGRFNADCSTSIEWTIRRCEAADGALCAANGHWHAYDADGDANQYTQDPAVKAKINRGARRVNPKTGEDEVYVWGKAWIPVRAIVEALPWYANWTFESYPPNVGGPVETYKTIAPNHSAFQTYYTDSSGQSSWCYLKTHSPRSTSGDYYACGSSTYITTACPYKCNIDGCLSGGSSVVDYLGDANYVGMTHRPADDYVTFGKYQHAGAKIDQVKVGTLFYRVSDVDIVTLRAFNCATSKWDKTWDWIYGYVNVPYPDGTTKRRFGWIAAANLQRQTNVPSPMYEYKTTGDATYLNARNDASRAASGWTYGGTVGRLYLAQQPGTVPLYRHYSSSRGDHILALESTYPNFVTEGVVGYVYPDNSVAGTVPLYRYYCSADLKHLYSLSSSIPSGCIFQQITAYVLP